MTKLLDFTGIALPATFVRPPRMLSGPFRMKWRAGWSSNLGSGKEWTPFAVFFQDADSFTDSIELRFVAGTTTVQVNEVGGNRIETAITFSVGDLITITADPVARTLQVEGAATGNGTFASGGSPWWPNADSNVRIGGYYTVDAFLGPIGGTFEPEAVLGYNLAEEWSGGLSLAGVQRVQSTMPISGAGSLSLAGQTNSLQLAITGTGSLALSGVARINSALTMAATGNLALAGESQGSAAGPFAAFLSALQALLPPGKAWTRDPAAVVTKFLRGLVPELVRVQERIDTLQRELDPGEAIELLSDYESIYGIPDECSALQTTLAGRRSDVLARLREDAGHNPADYIALAAVAGHAGAEVHRHPFPPFAVGESGAGERLYGEGGPAFYIVGYMANRIPSPNDFTTWSTGGSSSVDANAGVAPDGTSTADRLNIDDVTFSRQVNSPAASYTLQFSVWLRSESGEKPISLWCRAGGVVVEQVDATVGTQWRRVVLRSIPRLPITHVDITSTVSGTVSVLAWGAHVGVYDDRFECRLSHVQQAHTEADFRVIGDYPAD